MRRSIVGALLLVFVLWPTVGFGPTVAAQIAFPVTPDPAECLVEPRSLESFVALVGSPVAEEAGADNVAGELGSPTPIVLPSGTPADAAIVAAVTTTVRESIACNNAGDFLRAFALYTDNFNRSFVEDDPLTTQDVAFFSETPRPFPVESRTTLFAVREARVLGDGRIGALVDFDDPEIAPAGIETDFLIFILAGDRYLIDESIDDLEGTAAAGTGLAATPVATTGAELVGQPASDSFDGSALDGSWAIVRPEVAEIAVVDGALAIALRERALWAGPEQAVLVAKLVTGDFKATATVHARSAADPARPPAPPVRLGGLMARNPAGGNGTPENYVHVVVGHAPTGIAVETKTTVDNQTTYESPAWESGDAEVRICRVGAAFRLYKRAIGGDVWTLAAEYDRPDLPATLQVGVNAYAVVAPPDLRMTFDDVRFESVTEQAECERD